MHEAINICSFLTTSLGVYELGGYLFSGDMILSTFELQLFYCCVFRENFLNLSADFCLFFVLTSLLILLSKCNSDKWEIIPGNRYTLLRRRIQPFLYYWPQFSVNRWTKPCNSKWAWPAVRPRQSQWWKIKHFIHVFIQFHSCIHSSVFEYLPLL